MDAQQRGSSALAPDRPSGVGFAARPVQLVIAFLLWGILCFLVGGRAFRANEPRPTDRERVVVSINLNTASKSDLLQLPGVADGLVDAILSAHNQNGGFRSVDDLVQVKGVGPARLATMRPYLRVDSPTYPIDVPTAGGANAPEPPAKGAGRKTLPPAGTRIDLNRATAEQLQQLPGIGPVLSQRIVAERDRGPFQTIEELRRVSGIGPKTMEKLRPFVCVNESSGAVGDGVAP